MKQMTIQNTWSLRSASHTFREAFTAEQRARLFAAQREYILPKDEIIYRQDDTPHFLYYVLEGTVRLYREGAPSAHKPFDSSGRAKFSAIAPPWPMSTMPPMP